MVSCQNIVKEYAELTGNNITTTKTNKALDKCKILLVEDNPIVQKVHKLMLQKAGCVVDLAKDGETALVLSENDYDIILMDIGLPEMSGLEVTSRIRQEEENKNRAHTPIITLTAYSDDTARESSLAAGSDDVATKPIAFNDLCQLILQWISKTS